MRVDTLTRLRMRTRLAVSWLCCPQSQTCWLLRLQASCSCVPPQEHRASPDWSFCAEVSAIQKV